MRYKLKSVTIVVVLLSAMGCANSPDSSAAQAAGAYASLTDMTPKELYRGLVFGDGRAAELIPTVRDHYLLENNVGSSIALQELRLGLDDLLATVDRHEPGYLERFYTEVTSGDQVRIADAMFEGSRRAQAILSENQTAEGNARDKCAALAVAVLVVNIAAAANDVVVYDHEYFWSLTAPKDSSGTTYRVQSIAQEISTLLEDA